VEQDRLIIAWKAKLINGSLTLITVAVLTLCVAIDPTAHNEK
jgi:hypothetical protein